jgi:hypothetical protein
MAAQVTYARNRLAWARLIDEPELRSVQNFHIPPPGLLVLGDMEVGKARNMDRWRERELQDLKSSKTQHHPFYSSALQLGREVHIDGHVMQIVRVVVEASLGDDITCVRCSPIIRSV